MTRKRDARTPALDAAFRAALAGVALSGAALSAGALAIFGLRAGASVAVGATIAAANLWLLGRIVAMLLRAGDRSASDASAGAAVWALLAVAKMFGLLAVVWLLMRYEVVAPIAMLVGFGALPIGVAIGSLVSHRAVPPKP